MVYRGGVSAPGRLRGTGGAPDYSEPSVVMHAFEPSSWEAEAGRGWQLKASLIYIVNFIMQNARAV